ncbi:MAG: hypothetical protein WCS18_05165 [Sphaerochaetaceae bacterium]
MDNTPFIKKTFSWRLVALEVSRVAGKPYDAQYIREVATGYRVNHQIAPILKDLGVMQTEVA